MKVGDILIYRDGAGDCKEGPYYISVQNRNVHKALITKIWSHGARVKGYGYVNKKRIIGFEPQLPPQLKKILPRP